MPVELGSIVEGVVTGITHFGAFVELPGGVTGLVHISEVADTYVRDVRDFLTEGEKVKVKVINVDDKGKIGLSIKQTRPPRAAQSREVRVSFEDRLNKFLKESDERQQDIKRSTDSKRGGRGTRR